MRSDQDPQGQDNLGASGASKERPGHAVGEIREMGDEERLFRKRLQITRTLQPDVTCLIEEVLDLLDGPPYHPYGHFADDPEGYREAATVLYQRLLTQDWFSNGRAFREATVKEDYLYRITTIDAIADAMVRGYLFPSPQALFTFPYRATPLDTAYGQLYDKTGGEFHPLDSFASGSLRGERAATFWTTAKIDRSNVYDLCLKCGMCFEVVRPVILRLNLTWLRDSDPKLIKFVRGPITEEPSLPLVPAEIDAFAYPVFNARRLRERAMRGKTIDLSCFPQELKKGVPEYVVISAPAGYIDFQVCESPRRPEGPPEER